MTAHLASLIGLGCIVVVLASQVTSQSCSAFTWKSTLGENPLATHRGKVVLVALMAAHSSYCITQASRLDALKSRLASEGYPDIAMVIVNGGESISRNSIANLQNASSIAVIQDNEQHTMYQEIFRRNKDDFIVYDRCGQRSVVIPHPYSFLGYVTTERALKTVHSGRLLCHCQLDTIAENGEQMQSDEPLGPRDTTQTSTYVSRILLHGFFSRFQLLDQETFHNYSMSMTTYASIKNTANKLFN
ncbi:selenoprotein Pb-like isoform X2 [Biomphalaria glabrata]|uniref:Selenoprotein Pb-like isoform X2 n=1 Tax=Biomphalaria glabrata TaxID=6526 RepID=A0A9W3AHZ7_BIOGL|nr:selenoprotein Pb-like isoform X2 [Biomphalaria glabrata]